MHASIVLLTGHVSSSRGRRPRDIQYLIVYEDRNPFLFTWSSSHNRLSPILQQTKLVMAANTVIDSVLIMAHFTPAFVMPTTGNEVAHFRHHVLQQIKFPGRWDPQATAKMPVQTYHTNPNVLEHAWKKWSVPTIGSLEKFTCINLTTNKNLPGMVVFVLKSRVISYL